MAHELIWPDKEKGRATAMAKISLRFAPALEARFKRDRNSVWRKEGLGTGWVGLLMYDSFLYGDYMIEPSLVWRSAFVRLVLFTPIALVCLYLMDKVRHRNVLDASKMAMIVVAAAGLLFITVASSIATAAITQAGLLCLLFGALVFRMSMPFAVLTSVVCVAEEVTFIRHAPMLTREQGMTCLALVMSCVVGSLLANYRLERSERDSYRLLVEAEANQAKLQQLNTALEEISNRDGLTGLPNRRRFDEHSQRVSAEAWQAGLPVSIVMADIDHFKRLNDSFGHLTGDLVLAQVAHTLRSSVRGGNDLAARFGGEEFILVLPDATEADALAVAERIVTAVRREQLQVEGSDRPVKVTISCGVASSGPEPNAALSELISRADRALYEAKSAGRDRVCSHVPALQSV